MKVFNTIRWLKSHRVSLTLGTTVCALAATVLVACADRACDRAASGRLYRSVAAVPNRDVGLVLGCSKIASHGKLNPHFANRIEAAAALYRAGKVQHLLVSGDNHIATYDEPDDMRAALISAGVPADAITCDYAGFRTLDSVVRAREIFGLSRCTIISEDYHCPRALWIAKQHNLDAIAFAAPNVSKKSWSLRANIREQLARSWCAVDLYLLHRGPKFLGPKEPILVGNRASTDWGQL